MNLKETCITLHRYNRWANQTLLTAIPEGAEDTELVSSFNSIRKTAWHIWNADWIWLKRFNGEQVEFRPPSLSFSGTFAEGVQELLLLEDSLIALLLSKPEEWYQSPLTYKTLKGEEFTNTIVEVLQHLVTHSMFHRGQLVTLMRQAGSVAVPPTDLIVYYRQHQS